VHGELGVAQALTFGAQLRLPRETPAVEVRKLVIQTIRQLGLRDRASTRIARLSGGQRKRVSVGVNCSRARRSCSLTSQPPASIRQPSSN